jgi:N-acetylglucosamine repressor
MEQFHKQDKLLQALGAGEVEGALGMLRRRNAVSLLRKIRTAGVCSRAELARCTGLDPKTVTNLTKLLAQAGTIRSAGLESSSGGRPAESLELKPDGAYAMGVDLGSDQLRVVLVDLAGSIVNSMTAPVKDRTDAAALLGQVDGAIRAMLGKAGPVCRKKLIGLGFASPGFVDRKKGVVGDAVNLPGWRDIPIRDLLQKRFQLAVSVEESSRATALGELWFRKGATMEDFISLDLGYGIGIGIISNGRLHYGVSETAGEIGHTTVKPNGAPCHCGKRGCLETVCSGAALAGLSGYPSARDAAAAAEAGDSQAKHVFAEAGKYLGIAVSNVINILNPGLLILNGGLCGANEFILGPFKQSLKDRTLARSLASVTIERTTLGNLAGALGAASLPLSPLFEIDG